MPTVKTKKLRGKTKKAKIGFYFISYNLKGHQVTARFETKKVSIATNTFDQNDQKLLITSSQDKDPSKPHNQNIFTNGVGRGFQVKITNSGLSVRKRSNQPSAAC